MKIVCLFPGIGYTCDKPLLYYSWKMLSSLGWKVVPVPYSGFPSGVKGNAKKMKKCAEMALDQAEALLKDIEWRRYDSVLFVSKSVGTVVAGAYAARHHIPCRHVLFTPVEDTFSFGIRDAIVFHGTADPWADSGAVRKACLDAGLPLYVTENANHSLETGNIEADLDTMKATMKLVRDYAEQDPRGSRGISPVMEKMIRTAGGNIHDIEHFIKVWAYAKTIGELEGLDPETRFLLEAEAVTHDIACPVCREKYGNAGGKLQEKESPPLIKAFFADMDLSETESDRIAHVVGHHHTYTGVDGPDWQILLEADYIVNASENGYPKENIQTFLDTCAKTAAGKRLIREVFCL